MKKTAEPQIKDEAQLRANQIKFEKMDEIHDKISELISMHIFSSGLLTPEERADLEKAQELILNHLCSIQQDSNKLYRVVKKVFEGWTSGKI